ncbi:hypothetical protein ZWY2020_054180 [Hordeum vulgare]|nr:hypothetical protein ZWY2020_054180 [Hordeum vulgare]
MGEAALSFDVEAGELTVAARRGCRSVECMVCSVGFLTACMSAAYAIYKAPAGIFVGHKCAYYASVVVAGLFGLAEACAAVVWLSAGAHDLAAAPRTPMHPVRFPPAAGVHGGHRRSPHTR